MKILITGGLGFIGMNFINYWLSKYDDEILNIDKVSYASNDPSFFSIPDPKNYRFKRGDICDSELVQELVSEVDTVVNFAAESHVDNSIADPMSFVKTNIVGTQNLLEAIKKYDVRLHHISTDEVFGALDKGDLQRFNEGTRYNPQNPYSATKASADHLVNAYINTYGIKATISNCSNNFGPLQHPEKLIPKSILRFLEGKKAQLYGDGSQIRDWIYVRDHCEAIEAILKKGKIGESYLVGAENEKTNVEIIDALAQILELKTRDYIEFVKDRPGHDRRYAIDPSKIRTELGWKPSMDFNLALQKTVDFYKKYINFYAGK